MADLPTPKVFKTYKLRSVENVLSDRADNFRINTRDFGGQMWVISAQWPDLDQEEFEEIYNFLFSRRGASDTADFSLPKKTAPRGVGGGSPLVAGGSQTGNTLDIDGAPTSTTGWLLTGDLFTISGDTKVYRLTADADTDGGGAVTLAFEPELVASPADNAPLTITGVKFTTVIQETPEYDVDEDGFYMMSANFYEYI